MYGSSFYENSLNAQLSISSTIIELILSRVLKKNEEFLEVKKKLWADCGTVSISPNICLFRIIKF